MKNGFPSLACTLHTTVDASRAPLLNTKTRAASISAITARPARAFSTSSSLVWVGTHSSLNAIRYCVTVHSSHSSRGPSGGPPAAAAAWPTLTHSTNGGAPLRHFLARQFRGVLPG